MSIGCSVPHPSEVYRDAWAATDPNRAAIGGIIPKASEATLPAIPGTVQIEAGWLADIKSRAVAKTHSSHETKT